MNHYEPPFTITNKILDYVSKIMEKLGQVEGYTNFNKMPVLRRNNKIKEQRQVKSCPFIFLNPTLNFFVFLQNLTVLLDQ